MYDDNPKDEFLDEQIWKSVIGAGLSRGNKTYDDDASKNNKAKFKEDLRGYIQKLVKEYYVDGTNEKQHMKNIEEVSEWTSKNHEKVLANGKLRIGKSQKILNLYLKYLWCLDKISMPPHCPLDRNLIKHVDPGSSANWTEMDSMEKYKNIMKKARKKAEEEDKSLAQWELEIF